MRGRAEDTLRAHFGGHQALGPGAVAHQHKKTLREAAIELGHLSAEEFDKWVRPERMTRPED